MEEEDRPNSGPEDEVTQFFTANVLGQTRQASFEVSAQRDEMSVDERLLAVRSAFASRGYDVIEELGRGGMGVVYKARDTRLKRLVALKMILAGVHAEQRALARFRAEAEVLARVEHPGIVQVYEVGELDGHPYLALEYVEGGSLTDLTERKPVDAVFAARILEAIARAVQEAHDQGIAHRDLKPDNILMHRRIASSDDTLTGVSGKITTQSSIVHPLSESGSELQMEQVTPKVADFGLAKQVDVADHLTRTGAILGSPNYMSPEQASGNIHDVGFSADIYALGAILYYLLTGRPPFLGTTAAETIVMVRDNEPVAPTQLQPKLSKDIETICLKCLEKDPNKRFASARELKDELGRFIRGEPILSRPISSTVRAWRWCRRNAVLAGSLSAVGLSLAAVFVTAITAAIWMAELVEEERVSRQEAESHLIQLHTTNGLRLTDQGSLSSSLPWFAEAIRLVEKSTLDSETSDRAMIPRLRWAATLRQCPKFSRLWFEDNFLHQSEFFAEGSLVVVSGQSGLVRVLDVETGEIAGPPLAHPDDVYYSTLAPEGHLIATTCEDHVLRLWDWTTGEIQNDTLRHSGPVYHASFDVTGNRIVSASQDGTARIWNVATGEVIRELKHDGPVLRSSFDPGGDLILTASADGTARLWDANTGAELARLPHDKEVRDAVWSLDGQFIATASRDNTGRVWNRMGDAVSPPLEHQAVLTSIAFSHDGLRVVTASEDQTARVWDAQTGAAATGPLMHSDYVSQASFSPDGRFVLTASEDSNVVVWNSRTGQPIGQPLDHHDRVTGAVFSPNGRQVLTRVTRRTTIWDLASIEQSTTQFRHEKYVRAGVFSPDGMRVATGGDDQVARIWSAKDGSPLTKPLEHRFPVTQICFTHDGKWLLSAGVGNQGLPKPWGELRVWDAATGEQLHVEWFDNPVELLGVHQNGKYIGVACGNQTITLETATFKRVLESEHLDKIFGLDFHPTENWLATGSYDKTVQIWDLDSGRKLGEPFLHEGRIDHVEFSSDGKWLLTTCSGEGEPSLSRIWDLDTHKALMTHLEPDSFYFLHAAFSPSLDRFINCLSDSAVICDSATGIQTAAPMRHAGMVQEACFSPDGRLAATASWDRTARVWDVETGMPVSPPLIHSGWVTHVEFSPDGNTLLTVSQDRAALIWNIRGTDDNTQQIQLISELLSYQRASISGVNDDISLAEAREGWNALQTNGTPLLLKGGESQIVAWHLNQLKDASFAHDWNAALFHSKQIIQIRPEQTSVWIDRGLAHAELEHWSSAADSFARADSENVSIEFLCNYALVAAACEDTKTYAVLCKRLNDRFSGSLLDPSLSATLLTCSLRSDASVVWNDLIEVAQANPDFDIENPHARIPLATAMYRAGKDEELLALLGTTGAPEMPDVKPLRDVDRALSNILVAMAGHRTGEQDAMAQLDLAKKALAESSRSSWNQRLYASLLLAEAEQTLTEVRP